MLEAIAIQTPVTPLAPVNPIVKEREQKYYAWKTSDGEWVRSEYQRREQWESKGIMYVLVSHQWLSYRNPLNNNGEKDVVIHTVTGTSEARADYHKCVAPTATVVTEDEFSTVVRWSF